RMIPSCRSSPRTFLLVGLSVAAWATPPLPAAGQGADAQASTQSGASVGAEVATRAPHGRRLPPPDPSGLRYVEVRRYSAPEGTAGGRGRSRVLLRDRQLSHRPVPQRHERQGGGMARRE